MPQLLVALLIVVGGLWVIRKYARATVAQSRAFSQKLAGGGLMAFAGWLLLRGQVQLAVPLFLVGLGLAGKSKVFPNGFPSGFPGGFRWGGKPSAGLKSRVATSLLEMELDHDTGTMAGTVLSGPDKGRQLAELTEDALRAFHNQCRKVPDQSLALFEAWLDRNRPEWRGDWGQKAGQAASAASGAMSKEEALSVLGLQSGATPDQVKAAHKRLMKEFHPDKGGSDYLAAKINAAKDALLP